MSLSSTRTRNTAGKSSVSLFADAVETLPGHPERILYVVAPSDQSSARPMSATAAQRLVHTP